MQRNQIIERVRHLDEVVHRAADAARADTSVPDMLKQSITALTEQTMQARQLLQNEQDQARIIACIDNLEALGDRAKRACEQAGGASQQVKSAVAQAHSELSNLKHQLH